MNFVSTIPPCLSPFKALINVKHFLSAKRIKRKQQVSSITLNLKIMIPSSPFHHSHFSPCIMPKKLFDKNILFILKTETFAILPSLIITIPLTFNNAKTMRGKSYKTTTMANPITPPLIPISFKT